MGRPPKNLSPIDGRYLALQRETPAPLTRLQPENFDARVQLAVALVRAGDHGAAVPTLQALIDARPEYLPAYDNLSYVLAQLGRLDDAENACRQALKIDPNYESARRNLQLILAQ